MQDFAGPWKWPLQHCSMEPKREVYPLPKDLDLYSFFTGCSLRIFRSSDTILALIYVCGLDTLISVLCLAGFGNLPGDMVC